MPGSKQKSEYKFRIEDIADHPSRKNLIEEGFEK